MKLSLVIVNDNNELYLKSFFKSLGIWKKNLDIVFVDNHSEDNSVQIARAEGIKKIISEKHKRATRPELYNAAISQVEGDYTLFAHSDIVWGKGFFENLVRKLENDADLDCMNFRVMYIDDSNTAPSVTLYRDDGPLVVVKHHSLFGVTEVGYKKLITCSDSCFMVKTSILKIRPFIHKYKETLFIEDFILKGLPRRARVVQNNESYVKHYFIEQHIQLKTIESDTLVFSNRFFKNHRIMYIFKTVRNWIGKKFSFLTIIPAGFRVIKNEGWLSFCHKGKKLFLNR